MDRIDLRMSGGFLRSGRVRFHPSLAPLMAPIDNFRPHPDNYNSGDLEEIDESFAINGMYRPIEAQKSTGYIIAGNSTWTVCKDNDSEVVPVVELDVDAETALRIMHADNETARLARPDRSQELANLRRLAASEHGLRGTGRDEQHLAQLEQMQRMVADFDEWGQWPTITMVVPPYLRQAFYELTNGGADMRERFEILLRLAGWTGPTL